MAQKKKRRPRKKNARRGITKAQYKKLLAEIRRRKNGKRKKGRPAAKGTKSHRRPKNPAMRKGKTGRWYKGPRGVKVRVRRSKGKFVVDLRK